MITSFCHASDKINEDSTKNSTLDQKIQFQASIGIAYTNFSYPSPGYGNRYLAFIHSDFFLLKKVSPHSDIRIGLAYEPVGYGSDIYLANGQSSFTKFRLFYGNIHLLYGYQLSKPVKRIKVIALTGIFVGKLFTNDIMSFVKPDNILYRTKDITTFNSWNAGVSLGISGAIPVLHKSALGLKVIYHVGTTNIYNQESTDRTGIKRYTRSVSLSTFFNF